MHLNIVLEVKKVECMAIALMLIQTSYSKQHPHDTHCAKGMAAVPRELVIDIST
jgi:hypothetical protein